MNHCFCYLTSQENFKLLSFQNRDRPTNFDCRIVFTWKICRGEYIILFNVIWIYIRKKFVIAEIWYDL